MVLDVVNIRINDRICIFYVIFHFVLFYCRDFFGFLYQIIKKWIIDRFITYDSIGNITKTLLALLIVASVVLAVIWLLFYGEYRRLKIVFHIGYEPNDCAIIEEPYQQLKCYEDISRKFPTLEVCSKLNERHGGEGCAKNFGKNAKSISECSQFKKDNFKEYCKLGYALQNRNLALCETLPDNDATDYWLSSKELCISLIAEDFGKTVQSASLCSKFGKYKKYCLLEYVRRTRDMSLCDKLPDNDGKPARSQPSTRSQCINIDINEYDRLQGIEKIFLKNTSLTSKGLECESVFPVTRVLPKTSVIEKATLQELIRGLRKNEKDKGYYTEISDKVKINSFKIENRIAYIDFSNELEAKTTSCRSVAIKNQIKKTLTQFSTIDDVVISVEGKGANKTLQP